MTRVLVCMLLAFSTLGTLGPLGGCGPSSAQIKTAKTAIYTAPPSTILDIAVQVTQQTYKIGDVDVEQRTLTTMPQFYNQEGGRQSPGKDGFVTTRGGSVTLTMIVQVLAAGPGDDRVIVKVTPKTYQVIEWSPQPRELAPDDPNLPPWVRGRADALALAIYESAKSFAAGGPPGAAAPGPTN